MWVNKYTNKCFFFFPFDIRNILNFHATAAATTDLRVVCSARVDTCLQVKRYLWDLTRRADRRCVSSGLSLCPFCPFLWTGLVLSFCEAIGDSRPGLGASPLWHTFSAAPLTWLSPLSKGGWCTFRENKQIWRLLECKCTDPAHLTACEYETTASLILLRCSSTCFDVCSSVYNNLCTGTSEGQSEGSRYSQSSGRFLFMLLNFRVSCLSPLSDTLLNVCYKSIDGRYLFTFYTALALQSRMHLQSITTRRALCLVTDSVF